MDVNVDWYYASSLPAMALVGLLVFASAAAVAILSLRRPVTAARRPLAERLAEGEIGVEESTPTRRLLPRDR